MLPVTDEAESLHNLYQDLITQVYIKQSQGLWRYYKRKAGESTDTLLKPFPPGQFKEIKMQIVFLKSYCTYHKGALTHHIT